MRRLCDMAKGDKARVIALTPGCALRRRMMDIGLTSGAQVECVGKSPLGDPSAYLIRGAVIAIRNTDAAGVEVQPCS